MSAEWVLRSYEARKWLPMQGKFVLRPAAEKGRALQGLRQNAGVDSHSGSAADQLLGGLPRLAGADRGRGMAAEPPGQIHRGRL